MNPPKTAQIVKTKLIDLHTGTESLGCLSVTSGILILKKLCDNENKLGGGGDQGQRKGSS